jgi:hypothetical protein
MDYKIIVGGLAVVLGILAYLPYFKSIFYGRTKPHMFSWFVWFLIQGIAFFVQTLTGAGPGAWVTGLTSVMCLSVFIISLSRGEKNITAIDKVSFTGALLGISFWVITKNPLSAVIFVSIADFLGFVPTFRKSYFKPFEEATTIYALYVLVWALSLSALSSYNLTTVLYPASLLLTNGSFALMSIIRKKKLGNE